MIRELVSVVGIFMTGMGSENLIANEPQPSLPDAPWVAQCKALPTADFSRTFDAPAQIKTATVVSANETAPAHCKVQGYVWPQVGFEMVLPALEAWNEKYLQLGCGGDCGFSTGYAEACRAPLRKGYACIGSDAGHSGGGGLWAKDNLQAQVDFGYRAPHVTALAGKAIAAHYFGSAPKFSYFMGGSTGGRQALVQAQRFPWDFDGIVSGAPWINDTDSAMNLVWAYRALSGPDGKSALNRADLGLLRREALARCDLDDGVRDRVIGNPAACRFDPARLLCKAGKNADCLTQVQIDAVKKVYAGPVNSKGERTYVGGAVPGSEMGWVDEGILDYLRENQPGGGVRWALDYFRYMVMPAAGPDWQLTDFDFDRDYKRFGTGTHESLLNAANPDLRKFKAAGAKLIIYQGWNDQSDLPQMTIDYYEMVTRAMGGRRATEDFARLFLLPGVLHGTGGDGAFAVDYLTYLEDWVERGRPPDKLLAAHVDDRYLMERAAKLGNDTVNPEKYPIAAQFWGAAMLEFPLDPAIPIAFTRPVYPYPLRAKYKGSGNPNDASSFEPVEH